MTATVPTKSPRRPWRAGVGSGRAAGPQVKRNSFFPPPEFSPATPGQTFMEKVSFLIMWLLVVALNAQCFSFDFGFVGKIFSRSRPKSNPNLPVNPNGTGSSPSTDNDGSSRISPLKSPKTETDFKVNEIIGTLNFDEIATKADLMTIEEKMATKSDLESTPSRSDTKSDLEEMEEEMATKLDIEAVREALWSAIEDLTGNRGVRSEQYASAWMAQHISETKNISLKSGTFKREVIKAPEGKFLFFNKNGKEVNSIELDCYSVEPVHAVGEYNAIMKLTDSMSKDSLLEKVDLFVRKVKYLKVARESLPLAFFCVAEMDFDLVDEIVDILREVDGVLVANIDKRNPFVEASRQD
jgi:hypothetical protein